MMGMELLNHTHAMTTHVHVHTCTHACTCTYERAEEKRQQFNPNDGRGEVDEPVWQEWCDSEEDDVPEHVVMVTGHLCLPALETLREVLPHQATPHQGRQQVAESGTKGRTLEKF